MIKDPQLTRAVSQILQRSERQEDLAKLTQTFYDIGGILPQLENRNNQVLYGRRGTGKTHVFRVLESVLAGGDRVITLYIDARTLGSTAQFSDTSIGLPQRCLALFRDVLNELHNALLEYVVNAPPEVAERALDLLDRLSQTVAEGARTFSPETLARTEESTSGKTQTAGIGLTVSPLPSGDARTTATTEQRTTTTATFELRSIDRIYFPDLHAQLAEILRLLDAHLYILFDEWSSLPEDVQPYLAEFLKRGVLPVSQATLKIASLEYRSQFALQQSGRLVGFELGADVATATDLDDYFVFDRNPPAITAAYAEILFRHLNAELPPNYLKERLGIDAAVDLPSRLFTEYATFRELARASEGVVRDLINIFTKAYFDTHRRGRDNIDLRAILEASRQWFEQDKSQHLDDRLHRALRNIVENVIGRRKARSFLLPKELERHPTVQRLFDARVLHLMQRGYADKDNPGIRYNIFTLDYGTYVDLLNTSKEPQVELMSDSSEAEVVVPFDDKRSIRRIVLTEEALN